MLKTRVGLIVLLAMVAILNQGCVEYGIAKLTADSTQSRSAYSDYIFHELEIRAQHPDGEQNPILSLDKWRDDIYYPHLEYANYCQKYSQGGVIVGSLMPYEIWKQTEYKKMLADLKKPYVSPKYRDK